MIAWLELMADVDSRETYRHGAHPDGLFQGLQNERETRATARAWLHEMMEDARDHRALGMAAEFSIRLLVPKPFRTAILAVASREGWQPEAVMQGVMSNINWFEHHATQLKETARESHSRKATIPMFGAGQPSTRKTSLAAFISRELHDVPGVPDEGCRCSDGTMRGFLNCIASYSRGGLVTDEITTSYETSLAQSVKGVHLVGKPKVNTFVNGETSITMTGHGTVNLGTYAFLHQVWGQFSPVEEVLARDNIGFRKRFNIVWFGKAAANPNQQCSSSREFLKGCSAFLCQEALPTARVHHFDNFALSMFRSFQEGVTDYIEAHPDLDQLIVEKLHFLDTDVQRLTNAEMRMCQYAETCTQLPGRPSQRAAWDVYELAHALHAWRRQMALYVAHTKWDAVNGPRPAPIGRTPEPGATGSEDVDSFTRRLLLGDPRCQGEVTSKQARKWVRRKLISRGESDVAGKVQKAIQSAADAGVVTLTATETETGEKTRKVGGRPVLTFRKRAWSEIESTESARAFLDAIGISADVYER